MGMILLYSNTFHAVRLLGYTLAKHHLIGLLCIVRLCLASAGLPWLV